MSDKWPDAYEDRNHAVLLAAELAHELGGGKRGLRNQSPTEPYRAGYHTPTNEDDADADEWRVVWIQLPTGQVTWHVPAELVDDPGIPCQVLPWDGHDRDLKNDRITRHGRGDY